MQTVSIVVSGRVQGVFFRKYTLDAARKNGLSGFVKNTQDGNVYIEATGDEKMINEFVKWCHSGSPLSKVQNVSVSYIEVKKFDGFSIRN